MTWGHNSPLEVIQANLVSVWNMDTNRVVYSRVTHAPMQTLLVSSLMPYNNYGCSVAAYNSQDGIGLVPLWIPNRGNYYITTSGFHVHL